MRLNMFWLQCGKTCYECDKTCYEHDNHVIKIMKHVTNVNEHVMDKHVMSCTKTYLFWNMNIKV